MMKQDIIKIEKDTERIKEIINEIKTLLKDWEDIDNEDSPTDC